MTIALPPCFCDHNMDTWQAAPIYKLYPIVTLAQFAIFFIGFQLCDSSYNHSDSIYHHKKIQSHHLVVYTITTYNGNFDLKLNISQGPSVYEEASLIFLRQYIEHRFLLCIILLQLCYCPGQTQVFGCLVSISTECFRTHLPPPPGAAELIACTISVVRASSKLVINSTFFPSGQPGKESNLSFF